MLLKYDTGSTYSFNESTTAMQISTQFVFDSRGRADKQEQTWQITTVIQDDSQTGITSKISDLVSALSEPEGTLTLYNNNGTTPSAHIVTNCHTQSISYPKGTGAEYANQRTVELSVTGYTDIPKDDDIVSFQETLSFSGGGARNILHETISSTPKKYQTNKKTIYRVTQSGSATGKTAYPTPPGKLFPGQEIEENAQTTKNAPYKESGEQRFNITWSYQYASATEFANTDPNTWAV